MHCRKVLDGIIYKIYACAGIGRKLLGGSIDFTANFAALQQSAANVALQVGDVNKALQTNLQAANIGQSGAFSLRSTYSAQLLHECMQNLLW